MAVRRDQRAVHVEGVDAAPAASATETFWKYWSNGTSDGSTLMVG